MTLFNIPQPGSHLQREARVSREYTDQHGIKYYSEADAVTQQPIGELQPIDRTLPFQPPMRFAKFKKRGDLNFVWDYDTMARECGDLVAQYYNDAIRYAQDKNIEVPEPGGPIHHRIRAELGLPPLSPLIPKLAEAGDPWLLGVHGAPVHEEAAQILIQTYGSRSNEMLSMVQDRVNKQVAERMGKTVIPEVGTTRPAEQVEVSVAVKYSDFVKEGKARGLTSPEISLAWSEHKKHMAEELEEIAA